MNSNSQTRLTTVAAIAAMALLPGACGTVSVSPEAMPPTVVCLDGKHGYGPRREAICANHDGVSRWLDTPGRRIRRE